MNGVTYANKFFIPDWLFTVFINSLIFTLDYKPMQIMTYTGKVLHTGVLSDVHNTKYSMKN